MIEYNKALNAFNDYVKNYDLDDANIKLKVVHTMQVVKVMDYLTSQLQLSKEEQEIARIIALLHDFGRFEQWKRYRSFLDHQTIDHALFSCELLFKQHYIRNFIKDDQYDHLIEVAIEQHNKYKIDKGFSKRELMFIHLIRDADKLDNFRVKETEDIETLLFISLEELESQSITSCVYDALKAHQLVLSTTRVTQLDYWLSYIAFVYDLHFDQSIHYIDENHWIERSFDRIQPKNPKTILEYKELKQDMLDYVSNRL